MNLAASTPPVASHELLIFLLQVVVLLTLAFSLGRLAERLRLPAVVGELLAGVLVGPSLLGFLAPSLSNWLLPPAAPQARLLDGAAQIGVLLLVGVAGSYLDLPMLRRNKATTAKIGLSSLIIPLGLGIALATVLPAALIPDSTNRGIFALFLGTALCVTAIPVIAKTLSDLRMLHRDVGQLTLAAGVVDDTIGWFLLSVVAAMATVGVSVLGVSLSVLYLTGFVLLAFAARPAVRRLMRRACRTSGAGPTMAVTVIVILVGAAITQALGLEAIFGAFVAGTVVGSPGCADQTKLAPLRAVVMAVLAPLFLATAGLRMDLTTLADPRVALAGLAILAVAILGKFAGAYLGARWSRMSHWESLAMGAGMNSRGVVEVVIATVGLRLGVLNTATYTSIILVAVVTSLMGPPLLRMAMARVRQTDRERLRLAEHDSWDREIPSGRAEAA
ncbi:cation:proton antiporter [Actinophytocola sp.]|uniref:cation:proton antiporter n=1 Tax=Actinophytocola sp. TaxID=1872138 RepID=UPI002D80D217|nr:cation:proton antiporter [Actinophytocola sp.]HET9143339.1 cation:proton antiporter [Actinophytocola sp.]